MGRLGRMRNGSVAMIGYASSSLSPTIVLDTHALLWHAAESDRLSGRAMDVIAAADHLIVNAISAWEIAMLVAKGRLSLKYDVSVWVDLAGTLPKVSWVSLDPTLAVQSSRLPGAFHGDPADRMIAATAISLGAPVVTADKRIHEYPHVAAIW